MYTAFYHLREEPFRLTSDPRFFHLAQPHAAGLATVVEAVMRRKGFVVISGEIGTGKTTILHTVLRILQEKTGINSPIASAFILNPMLTREEFLEMILAEFEIPCTSTSKPARLAALQQMLLKTQAQGGTSVLLVDEAHLLSSELLEEIRLLSNADTYQEKPLQIVLSGQPEILPILRRPEMRALHQRIASRCTLRPLNLSELRAFVAERLCTAGLRDTTYPFSNPALEGVFKYSQGVPRLINMICDSSLSIGFKRRQPIIYTDIVEDAATELGLNDPSTEVDDLPRVTLPSKILAINGADREIDVIDNAALASAFDVIVKAMKRWRVSPTG
jgi:general secretion pathway protein A